MLPIQDLPLEIQLDIWNKCRKIAATQYDDALDGDVIDDASERLIRASNKAMKYCLFMVRTTEHELDPTKRKPPPHYQPTRRKCTNCDKFSVPIDAPAWKRQCRACYLNAKYPYHPYRHMW